VIHINPEIIVEKYKKFQDIHKLPHLSKLTQTFGFEIEDEEELLDQIRLEVFDKILSFTEKVLEPIIMGGDSYSSFFEQEMLSKKEREELFHIYRKIQTLKWENYLISIRPEEKKNADWINKAWSFWNTEFETKVIDTCTKLANGWNDIKFEKPKKNYLS